MSNPSRWLFILGSWLLLIGLVPFAHAYDFDPPGRVARLSDAEGEVSFAPAGEDRWLYVERNRPLSRGDRLWADGRARAELQVGSAAVRIDEFTGIELLDLGDDFTQIRLSQGAINLNVRRLYRDELIEVATPLLAFTITEAGRYRIDVDERRGSTTIVVWRGAGDAYGDRASFPLRSGDTVRFHDSRLRDYELFGLPRMDDFDAYCQERDRRIERSASLRYVDDDMIGFLDLDEHGRWSSVRQYGNVWFPTRVARGWAPYRDGHWVWMEPWGWTWIDDAPWGFAPSHYGRWVLISNRWGWIPGPRQVRPVYAPALVVFLGGRDWSLSFSRGSSSPVGWFPLGPRDVYVPPYRASRDYFRRVNDHNTAIERAILNRVYDSYDRGRVDFSGLNYAHRNVDDAFTVVPGDVFGNARSVRDAHLRIDRTASARAQLSQLAAVTPNLRSVLGSDTAARKQPQRDVFQREVFVREAPPPVVQPFSSRERVLQRSPGVVPAPAVVAPSPSRDTHNARNVRVIGEQGRVVNARDAATRRVQEGGAGRPASLPPLDRTAPMSTPAPAPTTAPSIEPERPPARDRRADRARGRDEASQVDVQQPETDRIDRERTESQRRLEQQRRDEQERLEQQRREASDRIEQQRRDDADRIERQRIERRPVEEQPAERPRSNAAEQLERNTRRADPAPRETPAESRKDARDDDDDANDKDEDRDEQAAERRKVRERGER